MKFLSSYYFRAHMYTIVPHQVREDMEWMADAGTDAVVVGVLEQDLFAAVENLEIIAGEAHRAGMKLFVTPSRWGSLVAGCPKVPSLFSAKNPEVWSVNKDGSPGISPFGPFASVHHPATFEFFAESLEKMFSIAPVEGIIWDEVKGLKNKDYSPAARKALKDKNIDDVNVHIDAKADFFEKVNAEALKFSPDCMISMFIFGHLKGYTVERLAQIRNLDCFGLDGRPYRSEDGGGNDSGKTTAHKLLLDQAPLFIETAHRNGKWAFMLIENHAMAPKDIDIMEQRLPEVLELDTEHVCYYYYPRSVSEADRAMNVLKNGLNKVKKTDVSNHSCPK